jgi:hypothetical protein
LKFYDCIPLQTQEWRHTFSAVVDAYREMIRREQVVSEELLMMGSMDKLADICPNCYGPSVSGKLPHEPNYIVCMDGNFQHRRHLAASNEIAPTTSNHSLFISAQEVQEMAVLTNTARTIPGRDVTLVR